jgi:SAM-dependent methyltransferase
MRDQRPIWEAVHVAELEDERAVSDFAREVCALLPESSRVLELGCATGEDSAYFASRGHEVLGIDFAEGAITEARKRQAGVTDLTFETADLSKPFDLPDDCQDLIYARLSLHYFSDDDTRAIFREMHRLLAPDGVLAFMCKSKADRLYGRGTELEPDVFESDRVRHFFSLDYARDCLKDGFEAISLREERAPDGSGSAFVVAIARRL